MKIKIDRTQVGRDIKINEKPKDNWAKTGVIVAIIVGVFTIIGIVWGIFS
jgi:hypothetical protein